MNISALGLVYKVAENCLLLFSSCSFTADLQIVAASSVLVAQTLFYHLNNCERLELSARGGMGRAYLKLIPS